MIARSLHYSAGRLGSVRASLNPGKPGEAARGKYFAEVIPLALRVMTHPSFDPATLARTQPGGPALLRDGLAERLASLARRQRLVAPSAAVAARLLVSLAHDWALGAVFLAGSAPHRDRQLKEMVDLVWDGLRAR